MILIEQMAEVAYEADRVLAGHGPAYKQASRLVKRDLRDQIVKVRAGVTPRDEHVEWSTKALREGWSYGKDLDHEAQTHPRLVAYEDLPADELCRDLLFVAIVRALSAI